MKNKIDIISNIQSEIMLLNEKYINESQDKYNFWEEHIKYVVNNAKILAKEYGANLEIVHLGALLHDVALIKKIGTKKEHHIVGVNISNELLDKYSYSKEQKEKVLACILNHRSSKNAKTIEELCVADADILAHFDNINMIKNLAIKFNSTKQEVINLCQKDFDDLSEKTKQKFKKQYYKIIKNLEKEL